jgi:hypothetical protein
MQRAWWIGFAGLVIGTSTLAGCGDDSAGSAAAGSGGETAMVGSGGRTTAPAGGAQNANGGRTASGGRPATASGGRSASGGRAATASGGRSASGGQDNPATDPQSGPPAGNPDGDCEVPAAAGLADSSTPTRVVGNGTPASCTGDAFIAAVAEGGVIRFDCGSDPVVITVDRPAKVFNDASDDVVIDGQGLVTLSGGGKSRILYMNTCDEAQHWTSDHCQDQETPRLTVQNLTFVEGNSKGEEEFDGGGAIWVRGGQFRMINTRFFNNVCADVGPDVGGAAVRVFSQYQGRPVHVVNSTFGGAEGYGNVCSNGGGLSSIGVSWTIINSLFSHNRAIGDGGNPAESGTPGGGSGGAIYNDGNTMTLSLCGTAIHDNEVRAYGSAIFFVSNNHTGTIDIQDSVIRNNRGGGWNVLPGISMHEDTTRMVANSTIE